MWAPPAPWGPPSCTGPHHPRETFNTDTPCSAGRVGRAVPAPVPGQLRQQVLPEFLALLQQSPSTTRPQTACCWLAPGQGRAGPAHHWDVQVSSGPGSALLPSWDTVRLQLHSRAGQLGKASGGPSSVCSCFPAHLLAPGALRAASVQEQPLLKQNNLQKYRYSLCPRPDLAKEEQGSCPGQGLAQPHRAFGHRGRVHPTLQARPVPSPWVRSHPPSKRSSHGWRFPTSTARSCPSPVLGQGTWWSGGCPPPRVFRGSAAPCRAASAKERSVCVCAAGVMTPLRPGSAEGC